MSITKVRIGDILDYNGTKLIVVDKVKEDLCIQNEQGERRFRLANSFMSIEDLKYDGHKFIDGYERAELDRKYYEFLIKNRKQCIQGIQKLMRQSQTKLRKLNSLKLELDLKERCNSCLASSMKLPNCNKCKYYKEIVNGSI